MTKRLSALWRQVRKLRLFGAGLISEKERQTPAFNALFSSTPSMSRRRAYSSDDDDGEYVLIARLQQKHKGCL